MALLSVLVFGLAALLIGWLVPPRWRVWPLLCFSILALFWLQPALPIRNLDFWLPTASLILVVLVWAITQKNEKVEISKRSYLIAAAVLIPGVVLLIALNRYLGPCCLTPGRPPIFTRVLVFLVIGSVLALLPFLFPRFRKFFSTVAILVLLGLFIILKSPAAAQATSTWLRNLTGQPVDLSSSGDVIWFGFSFLAFRLLHVLFDYRAGKLPGYRLDELFTYALFFPTLPAGPIDRSQHFIGELRNTNGLSGENRIQGSKRILWGIFKKFVVADSLALIALNSQNASQVNSTIWLWLLLYAFALRIYFDFSGYTDIAIGMGLYVGIKLPENFDRPYQKQNITTFWNSWHITLAQWFRAYYFNPLTRALRSRPEKLPTGLILFIAQFTTMLLIGLWHGITWNFAVWGAWHGFALFIHNRWNDSLRPYAGKLDLHPRLRRAISVSSWLLTFNFVALGWVWFAMPTINLSVDVFQRLFGFRPQ